MEKLDWSEPANDIDELIKRLKTLIDNAERLGEQFKVKAKLNPFVESHAQIIIQSVQLSIQTGFVEQISQFLMSHELSSIEIINPGEAPTVPPINTQLPHDTNAD